MSAIAMAKSETARIEILHGKRPFWSSAARIPPGSSPSERPELR
jgi:hypothetical protein